MAPLGEVLGQQECYFITGDSSVAPETPCFHHTLQGRHQTSRQQEQRATWRRLWRRSSTGRLVVVWMYPRHIQHRLRSWTAFLHTIDSAVCTFPLTCIVQHSNNWMLGERCLQVHQQGTLHVREACPEHPFEKRVSLSNLKCCPMVCLCEHRPLLAVFSWGNSSLPLLLFTSRLNSHSAACAVLLRCV